MFGGGRGATPTASSLKSILGHSKPNIPIWPRRGLSAFARDGSLHLSQVKVALGCNGQVRFSMEGWGITSLHAMFEDNDEDYHQHPGFQNL
jgi:hypothetical protein